ncbi:MAG TPA: phospholipase D-like domain-containing protein [Streptosporangiaceae bacterium]
MIKLRVPRGEIRCSYRIFRERSLFWAFRREYGHNSDNVTSSGRIHGPTPESSPVVLVDNARYSVVCWTFNFQRSSGLWNALHRAARRPEITMKVYVDTNAADGGRRSSSSPTTDEVAVHLKPALVLRTKSFDGRQIRNHSKFIPIDHRFLLVTSANFFWSAENANLEFGLLVDNPKLAESAERELRDAEDMIFEDVQLMVE